MTRRRMVLFAALFACAAVLAVPVLAVPPATAATAWPVAVSSSGGLAQSQGLPLAPGSVSSSCKSGVGSVIVLTWNAVAQATTYSVYMSTTSSSSGFSLSVGGITTTTWTSGSLGAGNFWFKVTAYIGSNWQGPQSASSAQRSVTLGLLCS